MRPLFCVVDAFHAVSGCYCASSVPMVTSGGSEATSISPVDGSSRPGASDTACFVDLRRVAADRLTEARFFVAGRFLATGRFLAPERRFLLAPVFALLGRRFDGR
jgi:hypothetical protein